MPQPPETIAYRYRIIRPLSRGGSGVVLLAEDTWSANRRVAIKLLPPELLAQERAVEALRREFAILKAMPHPHLVEVYDFGAVGEEASSGYYFTMEHVRGGEAFIATREASIELICALAAQVCSGLSHLHRRQVLHLDIKPANILVDLEAEEPIAKLADFGISAHASRTAAGLHGTLAYLPPEAAGTGPLDARADLYSLGVTLHHLLTGQLPFPQTSPTELLEAHRQHSPTPLRQLRPEVSCELETLVLKLLAKTPSARYESADEVQVILETEAGVTRSTVVSKRQSLLSGSPLLGRAQSLATALELHYEVVDHRVPAVLAIRGESGVGRSRFLAELGLQLQLRGVTVLSPGSAGGSLGGLQAVIRGALALTGDTSDDDAARALLGQLAEGEATQGAVTGLVRASFAELLLETAAARPLAVLVDDTEGLPSAAHELLAVAVRAALVAPSDDPGARLLIVYSEQRGARAPVCTLTSKRQQELTLHPLGESDVGRLMDELCSDGCTSSAVELLHRGSGGLPRVLDEILEAAVNDGALERSSRGWSLSSPASLQTLPTRRPAREKSRRFLALRVEENAVGRLLAITDVPLRVEDISAILGISSTATHQALENLRAAGIARTNYEQPDQWQLLRGRDRDTLLAAADTDEITALHEALASQCEALGVGGSPAHAWHVLNAPDAVTAVRYGLEAATTLRANGDEAGAARFLARALERLGLPEDGPDSATDPATGESWGQAATTLAHADQAMARLPEATAGLERVRGSMAPAHWRLESGLTLSSIHSDAGRLEEAGDIVSSCRELLAECDDAHRSNLAAKVYSRSGTLHILAGRPREALEIYEEMKARTNWQADAHVAESLHNLGCWVFQALRRHDDLLDAAQKHAEALEANLGRYDPRGDLLLAMAYNHTGQAQRALELYHRGRLWCEKRYRLREMLPLLLNEGSIRGLTLHECEPARALLERAVSIGKLTGNARIVNNGSSALAGVENELGRFGHAIELNREILARVSEPQPARAIALLNLGANYVDISAFDRAREVFESIIRERGVGMPRAVDHASFRLAEAMALQGADEEGWRLYVETMAATELGEFDLLRNGDYFRGVRIALARGDLESAGDQLASLRKLANPFADLRREADWHLLQARCLMAQPEPSWHLVEDYLEEATSALQSAPAIDLRAEILTLQGRVAVLTGRTDQAKELLAQASSLVQIVAAELEDSELRSAYEGYGWRREALTGLPADAAASHAGAGAEMATPPPTRGSAQDEELLEHAMRLMSAAHGSLLQRRRGFGWTEKAARGDGQEAGARPWAALVAGQPEGGAATNSALINFAGAGGTPGEEEHLLVLQGFAGGAPGASAVDSLRSLLVSLLSARQSLELATVDGATGLFNRQTFLRLLDERIDLHPGRGFVAIAGVQELERLKSRSGRQACQAAMRSIAQIVKEALGDTDAAGRFAENEIVFFIDGDAGVARQRIEKVRARLKAHPFPSGLQPRVAFGIAGVPPRAPTGMTVVERAWLAMTASADTGGESVEEWSGQTAIEQRPDQDVFSGIISGDPAVDYTNVRILLDTLSFVHSDLPRQEVLEGVMERVLEITGAERGILFLGPSADELSPEIIRNAMWAPATGRGWSSSVPRTVYETGEPRYLLDSGAPQELSQSVADLELRTLMCAPLAGRHSTIGVLYIDGQAQVRPLQESDLTFFHAVAQELARALEVMTLREAAQENEKLEADIRLAQTAQGHLLPSSVPSILGLDLAASSQPARWVGGDYFDFLPCGAGRPPLLALGDVSGKGIGAALVGAITKGLLSILAPLSESEAGPDLCKILARVGEELNRCTAPDQFITMLIARWDPETLVLSCHAGGHEPVLVGRHQGEVEEIRVGGLLLGTPYGSAELLAHADLQLQPGDVVLLYTDGLTDCRTADGDDFGRARLIALFDRSRHLPAAEDIASAIRQGIADFHGDTPLHDDVTLMVLRVQ